jgi:hypothetical protein
LPKLQSFSKYLKKNWGHLLKVSTWIIVILSSFVLPPPIWDFKEDSVWYHFAHFLVSALIGLMFIPMSARSARRYTRFWSWVCVVVLLMGIVTFFTYQALRANWTVKYSTERVVTGDRYTKEAENYRGQVKSEQRREIPDEELVMDYGGKTESIWEKDSIRRRRLIIAGVYIASLSLFAATIITLIQALYCNSLKRQPRVT